MEYQDKIFRHNLIKVYRIILIIVLLAAIGVAIKLQMDNTVYSRYELVEALDKPGSVTSHFDNVNGNLLCYSMDGVSAYDKSGRQLWNQTFQMQSILIESAGDYVVCADYQGTRIFLCGKNGLIQTIDTSIPVLSVNVSAGGIVMAQLLDGDTVFLRMYAQDGSLITNYRTTMRNFGYPLTYTISPDNIKVGISFMKAVSGKVSTSLAFYNFGGVGQNETDNLVSAYECEDETVPYIVFMGDGDAFAAGSKKIRIFSGKQKPMLQKEIETDREIRAVFNNQNFFVIVTDSDTGRYDLHLFDKAGNEKMTKTIDFEYTDICVEDSRLLVYNQTRFMMINNNGTVKYDGELGGSVIKVISADQYAGLLVVYEDKMERIRLR